FFSSRRRHTRSKRDWSSDVCSSDLGGARTGGQAFGDALSCLDGLAVKHWRQHLVELFGRHPPDGGLPVNEFLLLHFDGETDGGQDRKSTRLNSSHVSISYAVFCLKK